MALMEKAVKFLKIIGNGPKSNRDYTCQEAFNLMQALIDGDIFSDAQLGALLLMMRRKTTTADELKGFLDAWEDRFPPQDRWSQQMSLLLANPFDGKKRSIALSSLAACSLVKQGIPVVIGGVDRLGPKFGATEQQLFQASKTHKLPIDQKYHPVLWDACELYPFYRPLIKLRNQLGFRSFLHTIEKCVNPYKATHAILTLHHDPYIERFIHMAQTRFESATLLFGEEGSADLCWKKPTRYIRVTGDIIEDGQIDPAEWQLPQLCSQRPGGVENTIAFWTTALTDPQSSEAVWLQAQTALLRFALGEGQHPYELFTR